MFGIEILTLITALCTRKKMMIKYHWEKDPFRVLIANSLY